MLALRRTDLSTTQAFFPGPKKVLLCDDIPIISNWNWKRRGQPRTFTWQLRNLPLDESRHRFTVEKRGSSAGWGSSELHGVAFWTSYGLARQGPKLWIWSPPAFFWRVWKESWNGKGGWLMWCCSLGGGAMFWRRVSSLLVFVQLWRILQICSTRSLLPPFPV